VERERLQAAIEQMDELRCRTVKEWAEDVGWGRGVGPEADRHLEQIASRHLELRDRLVDVVGELHELVERIQDLRTRVEAANTPHAQLSADLVVELDVRSEGEVEMMLEYTVAGACWRPEHRAELLEQQSPRIRFVSEACVWQNTGEDWENVDLYLSTERPSLGAEPPRLETDTLRARRCRPALAVEVREQEVLTAGLGSEARGDSGRRGQGLPGIDDGGESLDFVSQRKATVRSDGRAYRTPLDRFESSAELEYVCVPEVAPSVILKSTLHNGAKHPLLAGPVHLIRHSGLAGRTQVGFVAISERFELGWGSLSEVSVSREKECLKPQDAALSAWSTESHQVRVRLSNWAAEPISVRLTERIPVSEIEKLAVVFDHDRTDPLAAPDSDGFVHWSLSVPASGRAEVKLTYLVKRHADVVGLEGLQRI
jgi:uncharacterized protein (TIGR02231 family)